MSDEEIHQGKRLASLEEIVWRGSPSFHRLACDAFHLRGIAAYLALLVALDAFQAWQKTIPLGKALHDSVPLLVIIAFVLANVVGLTLMTTRTTRYTVTNRRVILDYGIAIPATLSLPFSRLQSIAVAINADQSGDISMVLKAGERMPFLKVWPHARPWHLARPQPMLRCVPQAAVVAGLLTRAVEASLTANVREGRLGTKAAA